jgi:hypothetical protein
MIFDFQKRFADPIDATKGSSRNDERRDAQARPRTRAGDCCRTRRAKALKSQSRRPLKSRHDHALQESPARQADALSVR